MSEIRVYAILLKLDNNMDVIMSRAFIEALGDKKNLAIVSDGIDYRKYIHGIVYRHKKDRDIAGMKLTLMGVKFDTRDDGFVEEEYWHNWDE